jgi:hypothetical protein
MSCRISLAALWETLSDTVRKAPGKRSLALDRECSMGFANFVFAYTLLLRVGHFDPRSIACIAPFATGALLISLQSARYFGELRGGNSPKRP